MHIHVKYPGQDALHCFETGDGPFDVANFRRGTLNGRTDLIITDDAGNELDPQIIEEIVPPTVKEAPVAIKSRAKAK